jgi:hypothetical protein
MPIIFKENTIIIGSNSIYELLASSLKADQRSRDGFYSGVGPKEIQHSLRLIVETTLLPISSLQVQLRSIVMLSSEHPLQVVEKLPL